MWALTWRDLRCIFKLQGKTLNVASWRFVLTDIHLHTFSLFNHKRSSQLGQTNIQPGDWILPNAGKLSLLDKDRERWGCSPFSKCQNLVNLMVPHICCTKEIHLITSAALWRLSKHAAAPHTVKTLKQTSMGTMHSFSLRICHISVRHKSQNTDAVFGLCCTNFTHFCNFSTWN